MDSTCRKLEKLQNSAQRCPGDKAHGYPQSSYSKDFHAGHDWIMSAYNLHDASKIVYNMLHIESYVRPETKMPLVKVRGSPTDRRTAVRRTEAWNAVTRHSRSIQIRVPEDRWNPPPYPSLQALYTNALQSFQKHDPEHFSPVMVRVMEVVPGTNSNPASYKCIECNRAMVESHFDSEPHRKKMRWNHQVERHVWNAEIGYWEDESTTPQPNAAGAANPL
jgi:hypothetical protein